MAPPPPPAAEYPPPSAESVVEEGVADPDHRRRRTVSIATTVVRVICGIFAVVLAVHIVLVLGSANQANGFAAFIDDWSAAVSLGLRDLFVPANEKVRVFLNDGMAAIAWLVIGALIGYLIRKFAMPSPRRVSHYRRVVR